MLIDTQKALEVLVSAGTPEEQARAQIDVYRMAEKDVATKKDLTRWALRIILANAAISAVLLALFSYVN